MSEKGDKSYFIFAIAISLGVIARFVAMTLGHNYDFESYCIVGEIVGNSRNVYAETSRYNYAPLFSIVQGGFYRFAQFKAEEWKLVFRVLIVGMLTLSDVGIACCLAKLHSIGAAIFFFLNPVSIIISGYHNQFDNMAILFGVLAVFFYNDSTKIKWKDFIFVMMIALSLIMKHIFFMLPIFLLAKKELSFKKKVFYAITPPTIFLMSFIPYVVQSKEAFLGVLNNVFLYRSYNNAPLLLGLYKLINFPLSKSFVVYLMLMLIMAYLTRKMNIEETILIYMISMVAFSSAVANQYLVIPMAALCALNFRYVDKIYMVTVTLFLILSSDGINLINYGGLRKLPGLIINIFDFYVQFGYTIAVIVLCFALISYYTRKNNIKL
ncbi:hypothetical protein [Butyrivibrio sp.]|uniref:hypothetical protein n=1 Tax=Butyrivibrio sp. TaxID=28121 RepID=UPI0025BAE389|nr:hypothetical protein [Butyrivibrio sp.]MBE5837193.1 hypothetical protein [Butyrivibrio sp.]